MLVFFMHVLALDKLDPHVTPLTEYFRDNVPSKERVEWADAAPPVFSKGRVVFPSIPTQLTHDPRVYLPGYTFQAKVPCAIALAGDDLLTFEVVSPNASGLRFTFDRSSTFQVDGKLTVDGHVMLHKTDRATVQLTSCPADAFVEFELMHLFPRADSHGKKRALSASGGGFSCNADHHAPSTMESCLDFSHLSPDQASLICDSDVKDGRCLENKYTNEWSAALTSLSCSGALVNKEDNTKDQRTAYFLTAAHCVEGMAIGSPIYLYALNADDCDFTDGDSNRQYRGYGSLVYTSWGPTDTGVNTSIYDVALFELRSWYGPTLPSLMGVQFSMPTTPNTYSFSYPLITYLKHHVYDAPNQMSIAEGDKYAKWSMSQRQGTQAPGSSGSPYYSMDGRIYGVTSFARNICNDGTDAERVACFCGLRIEDWGCQYRCTRETYASFWSGSTIRCGIKECDGTKTYGYADLSTYAVTRRSVETVYEHEISISYAVENGGSSYAYDVVSVWVRRADGTAPWVQYSESDGYYDYATSSAYSYGVGGWAGTGSKTVRITSDRVQTFVEDAETIDVKVELKTDSYWATAENSALTGLTILSWEVNGSSTMDQLELYDSAEQYYNSYSYVGVSLLDPGLEAYNLTSTPLLVCQLKGDVRKDGKFDVVDLVRGYAKLNQPLYDECADVNDDGALTATDMAALLALVLASL